MRGKLFFIGIIGLTVVYVRTLSDPLNTLSSFIIGGAIPGTQIILGWWPMIILAIICLFAMSRAIKRLRFLALEQTARTIVAEKRAQEFKNQNSGVSSKNKSVIAAPTSTTIH